MTSALLEDMARRPDLFVWHGAIGREDLERWLENEGLTLPDDLVDWWLRIGGGELFESETLLDAESLEVTRECDTLEGWYRLVRAEFAERYGLSPLSTA